jgi:hypothetical protein
MQAACGDKCADVSMDGEYGIKEGVVEASLCCKARSGRTGQSLKKSLIFGKSVLKLEIIRKSDYAQL